ncbi:hypothetical protein A2634_03670, partial [Candidatus Amesbacteria bacterium RIFCSPHIGHO2_01_FULL_48_32]
DITAGSSKWQLNSGVLSPFSLTTDVNLGSTATASAKISLAGSLTRGLAAVIINQTEAQDIFAASASGTNRFVITNAGNVGIGVTTPTSKLQIGGASSTISNTSGDITITPTTNLIISQGNVGILDTTPEARLEVTNTPTGKALAIFNGTRTDQNILVASSSGATRMTLDTSGNLTLGLASSQQGGLVLANTTAFTTTLRSSTLSDETYTFTLPINSGDSGQILQTDGAGATSWITNSGGTNFWQSNSGALTPFSTTLDINLGATATSSAKISLAGSLTRGLAAVIINQTELSDIFAASASGINRFRLTNNGDIVQTTTETTGTGYSLLANSLTTGLGFDINSSTLSSGSLLRSYSTSTALSSGNLGLFNWEPSAVATASGDLFRINIGSAGDTTGNLFNVTTSGSSLFSVNETAITNSLPTSFTAAGDVSIAYDINFTNQTASYLKSSAPLYIQAGEAFESNNLTLKTYNSGVIVLDTDTAGKVLIGTGSASLKFTVSDQFAATAAAMIENSFNGPDADGLVVKLGYTGNGALTNRFVTFLNGNGLTVGRIAATTGIGVSYDTTGADFAEYFVKNANEIFTTGDLVSVTENSATKSTSPYDSDMIGVVSSQPGFKSGEEGPDKVLVGIVGQVPVNLASYSPPIKKGDFLTSSTEPGRATRAIRPGYVVGKALENWTPGSGTNQVLVYLSVSWTDSYDYFAFDDSGNVTVKGDLSAQNLKIVGDEIINLKSSTINLEAQVASLSAQLNTLSLSQTSNQFPADPNWTLSTDSGRLVSNSPIMAPGATFTGQVSIGTLIFDDLAGDIRSATGLLSLNFGAAILDEFGNLKITGSLTADKINISGPSLGTATIPSGVTILGIETDAVSTASAIFATPIDTPIPVSALATDSGRFVLKIPTPLPTALKISWWIVN